LRIEVGFRGHSYAKATEHEGNCTPPPRLRSNLKEVKAEEGGGITLPIFEIWKLSFVIWKMI